MQVDDVNLEVGNCNDVQSPTPILRHYRFPRRMKLGKLKSTVKVMMHGCETCSPQKEEEQVLAVMDKAMVRRMFEVSPVIVPGMRYLSMCRMFSDVLNI